VVDTAFDPIKAVREEIAGLADVQNALARRERAEEANMADAETELNALRKIGGYVRIEIERKRATLDKLIAEKDKQQ
jgi:hypothetical protein